MFTSSDRRNADAVESDFVRYKSQHPEHVERLVPILVVSDITIPNPITNADLSSEQLLQLKTLAPWGYSFEVSPGLYTHDIDGAKNIISEHEHVLRMSSLSFALQSFALYGPWLDLGTNSGVIPITLRTPEQKVLGIDFSDINIQKANFLKSLTDISDDCNFQISDAHDFLKTVPPSSFDLISALGLFYHLSDPLGLLSLIYHSTANAVIIDTIVHNFPFSGWIQTISRHMKYGDLAHANDTRKIYELHPTFRGLVDALYQVGFSRIFEIQPSAEMLKQYPGTVYDTVNRRILVCLK